jgi:hypothetical protein
MPFRSVLYGVGKRSSFWSIGPEIGHWNESVKVSEIPHLNGYFGEIKVICGLSICTRRDI